MTEQDLSQLAACKADAAGIFNPAFDTFSPTVDRQILLDQKGIDLTDSLNAVIHDAQIEADQFALPFFRKVGGGKTYKEVSVLLTTTVLPYQSAPFADALAEHLDLVGIHDKPGSDRSEIELLRERYPVTDWSREFVAGNPQAVVDMLSSHGRQTAIILDIGGYYVPVLYEIVSRFPGRVVVVEDTQNGYKDYEELAKTRGLPCPVLHVAHSPLKRGEDFHVGSSAAIYGADNLLRKIGDNLQDKTVLTIGNGPIGSGVAYGTRNLGLRTIVCDSDPIREYDASWRGYETTQSVDDALPYANLIFSATGNRPINRQNFHLIREDTAIALLTSGDKEFDLEGLNDLYFLRMIGEYTLECIAKDGSGHSFKLLNGPRTINFYPNQSILGKHIRPVQAELLECAQLAAENTDLPNELIELSDYRRMNIAGTFTDHYRGKLE